MRAFDLALERPNTALVFGKTHARRNASKNTLLPLRSRRNFQLFMTGFFSFQQGLQFTAFAMNTEWPQQMQVIPEKLGHENTAEQKNSKFKPSVKNVCEKN